MKYNEYKGLDLVATGNKVLEQWKKEDAFNRVLKLREGAPEFIFFEGPPSANGMPGIHHVMARSIKDAVCRYKTQRGYKVRRRAGWDTHGLPVELGVEKKLGITKEDIGKTISVEEYNRTCRQEVMKYTAEWRTLTERVGYWVDMDDPYVTYDNRYIETLWYLLKDIYGKGFLYKGKSIQPYSPAAGTGLSSHELNQPGCYRDVKDTTCCAQFKVIGEEDLYFLAWTTTPWTLPSNTALCVGPNIDYVKVRSENPYTGKPATYILAKALVSAWFNDKTPYEVLPGEYKGSELAGMKYEQLIPWFNPGEGAFRVIPGDYVSTEEGTGVVHIAPTFGADDAKVARIAGVPGMYVTDKDGALQAQVDPQGRFYRLEDLDPAYAAANVSPEYSEWAGRYVKNAYDSSLAPDAPTLDIDLCVMLKAANKAFRIEKHVHTYPHCWRTDKPVLYYPLNSWFIKASAVREQMMALNGKIVWKPEATGTGRFGKWLENIQDWNLSRSRYWGTPLPIWRTEDGKEEICIGSIAELYSEIDRAVAAGVMKENPFKAAGFNPADMSKENYDRIDLHRPYVDNIFLVSPSGRKMTRETDLIDVWFDSGAMPYAQTGLRGIDSPDFGCTADFIAEGVDQTRGWFYTLHAIHTMVSGTPAFKRVISNGLVLDKKGEKMSKRLGNAVDPFKAMDTYGADALRWYMLTNAQPWDNLRFDESGVDEVRRKFFGTLYNSYSLFAVYANIDNFQPEVSGGRGPFGNRLASLDPTTGRAGGPPSYVAEGGTDSEGSSAPGNRLASLDPTTGKAGGPPSYVAEGGTDSEGSSAPGNLEVRPEFDRWMLSKLNSLIRDVLAAYEDYDMTTAGRLIQDFICDQFSNWYLRLNKKRIWVAGMDYDKLSAYQTISAVLRNVALLAAPIAPFYMDQLWRDVTGGGSVHFQLMPESDASLIDEALEQRMSLAQKATSMVLALRKKAAINVKQPLSKLVIPVLSDTVKEQLVQVKDFILSEVNVKEAEFITDTTGLITKKIKPNFKTLGKVYGARMKEIAAAFPALTQQQIAEIERCEDDYVLNLAGGDVVLAKGDYEISSEDMPGWLVATEGAMTIALDITITDELLREGTARELIRPIQNLRKDSGFEVTDRIDTVIYADGGAYDLIAASLAEFKEYVASQTLSLSVELRRISDADSGAREVEWDDATIKIKVTRK